MFDKDTLAFPHEFVMYSGRKNDAIVLPYGHISNICRMLSRTARFSVLFFTLAAGLIAPVGAYAAPGDITAVRIAPNGWYAEVDIEGFTTGGTYDYGLGSTFDPSLAKMVFTVTSQGYNSSGTLGTITRTVYATETLRKPYPNQTQKDEAVASSTLTVKVALSDFIYDDDKNGGAGTSGTDVTVAVASGWYTDSGAGGTGLTNAAVSGQTVVNGSTLDYPKVIGRWAWPGYERVSGDFLVESAVFHRFAQNGKPVAAVVYRATDGTNTAAAQTATDVTKSTRTNDTNQVLVYAATIPVANLAQSSQIEVNFTAYPWVGDEDSVLDTALTEDGVAQPEERLGPLYALNDKEGTYGVGYALVSLTGSDTTGAVYASQAAAESGNAFRTIGKAADALKVFHTATYGRANAGGGQILLAEGSHTFPGTTPGDLGVMTTWLTVRPASTASSANTIIATGTNAVFKADRLKIENVTFSVLSGSSVLRGRSATDVLWLQGNTVKFAATGPVHTWKTIYATQNQITAWNGGLKNFSLNKSPYALVRGNTAASPVVATLYAVLGNKNIAANPFAEDDQPAGHRQSENAIYAYNTLYNYNSYNPLAARSDTLHGIAIVQNVLEGMSTSQPLLQVSADSNVATTTNHVILWHNTLSGQRLNVAYNETGTISRDRLNWSQRFNSLADWNNKDDTFGTQNGNRVGSWPVGYNVGTVANLSQTANFPGEFGGLFSDYSGSPAYTNDASRLGTGLGNGDYTLTASSEAIDRTPSTLSALAVLPFDLLGNQRDDRPDSGAYEYGASAAVAAPTLTFTSSSTTVVEGDSAVLSWSAADADSCTAASAWNGAKPVSGTESTGSLTTPQTYDLSCTGAGGTVSKSVSITVVPPAPPPPALLGATLYVNGAPVGPEVDLTSLNLNWNTARATSTTLFTTLLRFASSTYASSSPWQFSQ